MVFSSRLSSVMTKKDLDLVMEELDDDDDNDVNNNNPNNNAVDGRTPEEVEEGKRNNDFLLFIFIFVLLNQSLFILFISFLYFPLLIQKHTQDTRITQYYVNYKIFLKRSM